MRKHTARALRQPAAVSAGVVLGCVARPLISFHRWTVFSIGSSCTEVVTELDAPLSSSEAMVSSIRFDSWKWLLEFLVLEGNCKMRRRK